MTTLRKLHRDFLQADAASVSRLLTGLEEDDVMSRFGLEARLGELQTQLESIEQEPAVTSAAAALFFGGRPVVGSIGIESEFGTGAISGFQDIVSKVLARRSGALGQRGAVANKSASTMHITNVVRGSFGFLLEEVRSQDQLVNTSLKEAVDDTVDLLDAFAEPSEEQFASAIAETDDRIIATARDFFDLLRQSEATLRLVAGERDKSFGGEAIARAAERAKSTKTTEDEVVIKGSLTGLLPDAHQFEFRREDSQLIRGRVERSFAVEELTRMNRELVGVPSLSTFTLRRVLRNGAVARETYLLTKISAAAPDERKF